MNGRIPFGTGSPKAKYTKQNTKYAKQNTKYAKQNTKYTKYAISLKTNVNLFGVLGILFGVPGILVGVLACVVIEANASLEFTCLQCPNCVSIQNGHFYFSRLISALALEFPTRVEKTSRCV